MSKQLNIRSDEAHALACTLAEALGQSTTAIVTAALREFRDRLFRNLRFRRSRPKKPIAS